MRNANAEIVNTYITYPKGHKKNDTAILYLTDIFGLPLINNLLLVPLRPLLMNQSTDAEN